MHFLSTLIAASAQRKIGYVIAAIVLLAMLAYWFFNWLDGRGESGAELELAPNRKPAPPDEIMETSRLDLSLTGGLALLTMIAVALPLYWLGEPGRHEGLVAFTDSQAAKRGAQLYEDNCAQCHGTANGEGGVAADYSLVDRNGVYVQQVQWKAPSLAAVLDRFSYDELKYILNYGRPNSPMPAWGAPGGGPMTDQQLDNVIAYLASEQQTPEEIAKGVVDGLELAAKAKFLADHPDVLEQLVKAEDKVEEIEHKLEDHDGDTAQSDELKAELKEAKEEVGDTSEIVDDAAADLVKRAEGGDQVLMGELLFNNPAAGGAYGCARCHSSGWSWDANRYVAKNELIDPIEDGAGGFGPSLMGVARQFETAEEQQDFVSRGTSNGEKYGNSGQGDGGGQMPGFGACWAEDNDELARIPSDRITGHCDGRSGILNADQIAAIVAYERTLE